MVPALPRAPFYATSVSRLVRLHNRCSQWEADLWVGHKLASDWLIRLWWPENPLIGQAEILWATALQHSGSRAGCGSVEDGEAG